MKRWLAPGLLAMIAWASGPASAAAPPDPALFAYRQRTGSHLPMQAIFRDSDGGLVRFGALSHSLPMILALGYFHCPSLCGVVRADLFHALGPTGLTAGRDYTLEILSIDPSETSSDAAAAKEQDEATYRLPGADRSWHYLTGSAENIRAVADSVGFRSRLDAQTKLFIHPAGIVFATSTGVVRELPAGK